MLVPFLRRFAYFGLCVAIASCSAQPTSISSPSPSPTNPSAEETKTIVLADASKNPSKKIKRFQPLADYLAANLEEEFGITKGEVKIAPDLETVIQWLKDGEADLYIDSPYPAMLAVQQAGAQPILRRWKDGDAEYRTIIFTMADRGINSLADLKGKSIAFDDNRSTTGYMLPLFHLLKAGLNPAEKPSMNSLIATSEVGYVFSNDDDNTTEWTIEGKTAAGALDNQTFEKVPEDLRTEMKVLVETENITRNIVLVRANMPPSQIEAIETVLLAMDKTPEGQAVLKQFAETTKFDRFPTTASLKRMQEIYDRVQAR